MQRNEEKSNKTITQFGITYERVDENVCRKS